MHRTDLWNRYNKNAIPRQRGECGVKISITNVLEDPYPSNAVFKACVMMIVYKDFLYRQPFPMIIVFEPDMLKQNLKASVIRSTVQ